MAKKPTVPTVGFFVLNQSINCPEHNCARAFPVPERAGATGQLISGVRGIKNGAIARFILEVMGPSGA